MRPEGTPVGHLQVLAVSVLALLTAGCSFEPGKGARKNAGEKCLECHRTGGKADEYVHTFGGTTFPAVDAPLDGGVSGAEVVLRDARGVTVKVVANAVGNFWSDKAVAFPVSAEVRRGPADGGKEAGAALASPGPTCLTGNCNECHTLPPAGGARGRIAAPR